jgi:hypothetical protein
MHMRGFSCGVVFVVGAFAHIGCSNGDRPTTIPISGRVTLDGKPPGESGNIYFTVVQPAEGYPRRPANGAFDVDGVYRVMSWKPDDGLVPGSYRVSVVPGDAAKTVFPEKYHRGPTSGLTLEVPADQSSIVYNIELKSE